MKKPNPQHTLIHAARQGHTAKVERLLAAKPSQWHRNSALYEAVNHKHTNCVRLLLKHVDPKDNGSKALVLAAAQGWVEGVSILLPHSDPTANGCEALQKACETSLECVKLLLPYSKTTEHYIDGLKRLAAVNDAEGVRDFLALRSPLAIDIRVLEEAARFGQYECVKLLAPMTTIPQKSSGILNEALESCIINHYYETAEFLWDLCEHNQVLAEIEQMFGQQKIVDEFLELREIRLQRERLMSCVSQNSPSARRRM